MGEHLVNYQVRTEDLPLVVRVVERAARRDAWVLPAASGWITVCDEVTEKQDLAGIRRLTKATSAGTKLPTIAILLHGSSVLMVFVGENGRLLDEYDSCPHYFGPVSARRAARTVGRPEVLLRFCRPGVTRSDVTRALDRSREHVFEQERLVELARLLGISRGRALSTYSMDTPDPHRRLDIRYFVPPRLDKARTVLGYACAHLPPGLVAVLLKHGADPNQPDGDGWTPLMLVTRRGSLYGAFDTRLKVARALLKASADRTVRDGKGRTAEDLARAKGDLELARVLAVR